MYGVKYHVSMMQSIEPSLGKIPCVGMVDNASGGEAKKSNALSVV